MEISEHTLLVEYFTILQSRAMNTKGGNAGKRRVKFYEVI